MQLHWERKEGGWCFEWLPLIANVLTRAHWIFSTSPPDCLLTQVGTGELQLKRLLIIATQLAEWEILTLYVHQSRGVTRTCLLSGLSLVLFSPDAEPKPGEPDSLLLLVIHHRAGPSPAIVQESHFPELARLVDGLVPLLLDGVLGGGEPPPPGQQFAPHERTVSSRMFLSCQSGRTVLLCCCEREGNSFSWTDWVDWWQVAGQATCLHCTVYCVLCTVLCWQVGHTLLSYYTTGNYHPHLSLSLHHCHLPHSHRFTRSDTSLYLAEGVLRVALINVPPE